MKFYSFPSYRLVVCYIWISFAIADIGSYLNSIEYDAGEFGKWPHQSYHSSNAIGPILNVQQDHPTCHNDTLFTMLGPWGPEVSTPSPMILDHRGHLVWNDVSYGKTWGMDVKTFQGESYLTFYADKNQGRSNGAWYMLNSSYDEVYIVRPAGDWTTDDHDFEITPDQKAVLMIELDIPFDLRPVGGPRNGWILESGFQEIDIQTGEVVFQWRASQHWSINESYAAVTENTGRNKTSAWDGFHLNSVQKDKFGNYLISSRVMNAVAYIDGSTGEFRWKLGGKKNDYSSLHDNNAATDFNGQHHAKFVHQDYDERNKGNDNRTAFVTIFDNGKGGLKPTHPTQGKLVEIDTERFTAVLRQRYLSPHIQSNNRGSLQLLPSGNALLGYGWVPAWSEFSADGRLLCDTNFAPKFQFSQGNVLSYRVLKRPWLGSPRKRPSLVVVGDSAFVSWNGATEVTTWRLEGAGRADSVEFAVVSLTQKDGFETEISMPKEIELRCLRAVGLDKSAQILGRTAIVCGQDSHDSLLTVQEQY